MAVLRPPPLWEYQRAVVEAQVTELVLLGVVQMGKTFALAVWLYMGAFMKSNSLNWWAAPTYSQAEVGFREMRTHLERSGALARITESRLRLDLVNGSRIECRSWERDENLLGAAVDRIAVDQAELLTPRARAILSTRRAATLGPMFFSGNAGIHGSEFWRLCKQAEQAVQAGSADMGFIRWRWQDRYAALLGEDAAAAEAYRAFIDSERRNLPSDEFSRLYEGEFLAMGAGVLDLTPVCVNGGDAIHPVSLPFIEPWDEEKDGPIIGGLDLGNRQSWTVLSLFGRRSGRLKAMLRFREAAWEVQAARVIECAKAYGRARDDHGKKRSTVVVFFDQTGVGGPVAEVLQRASVNTAVRLSGVVFNSDNKQDMVQALQLETEQRTISMPYIAEAVDEAANLERTALATSVRYKAPDGFNDDTVWSMGLALHGKARAVRPVIL